MRILLKAGADPTAQDESHYRTPLHTAAMVNDAELVKVIYISAYYYFFVFCINESSSSWGFQILLDAGVDANITNVQNTIPLHVALNRGSNSCVGLLLSAGANCNFQVSSPLVCACYFIYFLILEKVKYFWCHPKSCFF